MPSPVGAILVLTPLIFSLSDFNLNYSINYLTPYLMVLVSILLISKIPTFSFKKIKIRPKLTIFILFAMGIALVSLIFFTFISLFIFSFFYILSIPFSLYFYSKQKKTFKQQNEDDHEDVL